MLNALLFYLLPITPCKEKAERLLFPIQSKILAREGCDPEGKQSLELLKSFQGLKGVGMGVGMGVCCVLDWNSSGYPQRDRSQPSPSHGQAQQGQHQGHLSTGFGSDWHRRSLNTHTQSVPPGSAKITENELPKSC